MTILNSEVNVKETEQKQTPVSEVPIQKVEETPAKLAEAEIKQPPVEDENWRAFREARKKDRAEREAAERKAAEKEAEVSALKAAMEAAFSKNAPSPQAYQQYYGTNAEAEETEDQRIEKKVNALLAQKETEYKRHQEERERAEYPQRLNRELPDFKAVCSQENLDYLDYHYPEISRPLQRLQEGYDKWHDIYHAVKKLIPNHLDARREGQRAEANSQKPRSIASPNISPAGEPVRESFQATEQRRAENWARMQRILKGV